jgi:hypothetical protein
MPCVYSISAASSQTSLSTTYNALEGSSGIYFTIEQASKWREEWKKDDSFDPQVHGDIRTLWSNLRGRHHLFFVDNSSKPVIYFYLSAFPGLFLLTVELLASYDLNFF